MTNDELMMKRSIFIRFTDHQSHLTLFYGVGRRWGVGRGLGVALGVGA